MVDPTPVTSWDDGGTVQSNDVFACDRGGVRKKVTGSRLVRTGVANVATGFGTATPAVALHVRSAGELFRLGTTMPRGGGNGYLAFHDDVGRKGYLGYGSTVDDNFYLVNDLGALVVGANLRPEADAARPLGAASSRWSVVFAATPAISTSDAATKTVRADPVPTAVERAWARAIELLPFQFNDALAEKGAAARVHWGVIAQQVHAAGLAAGIADPFAYAFLCRDPLIERRTRPARREEPVFDTVIETETAVELRNGVPVQVRRPVERRVARTVDTPVIDERGAVVTVAGAEGGAARTLMHPVPVTEKITVDEEYDAPAFDTKGKPVWRWGIRYEGLLMFLLACARADAVPAEDGR